MESVKNRRAKLEPSPTFPLFTAVMAEWESVFPEELADAMEDDFLDAYIEECLEIVYATYNRSSN